MAGANHRLEVQPRRLTQRELQARARLCVATTLREHVALGARRGGDPASVMELIEELDRRVDRHEPLLDLPDTSEVPSSREQRLGELEVFVVPTEQLDRFDEHLRGRGRIRGPGDVRAQPQRLPEERVVTLATRGVTDVGGGPLCVHELQAPRVDPPHDQEVLQAELILSRDPQRVQCLPAQRDEATGLYGLLALHRGVRGVEQRLERARGLVRLEQVRAEARERRLVMRTSVLHHARADEVM